jgi:hypothetical protein
MTIQDITPYPDYTLRIVAHDGRVGVFDVTPYLHYEAFTALHNQDDFMDISNGGYFIEWACGADLSADTIEARWNEIHTGNVDVQERASFHTEVTTT